MKTLGSILATSAIFGGIAYSYIFIRTRANMKQHNQAIQQLKTIDNSRLSNISFGTNAGFQTDLYIMNQIDSGDYIFIQFQCSECLTPKQYLKCNLSNLFKLQQQFDTMGFTYRNAEDVWVMFNDFGQTKIITYPEVVRLPYIKRLVVQKNYLRGIQHHKNLKKIFETKDGSIHTQTKPQSVMNMANRINKIMFGKNIQDINDFRQIIVQRHFIKVRSKTNRQLRKLV